MLDGALPQHLADALDVQAVQRIGDVLAQRDMVRHQRSQGNVVGEVVAREAVRLEEARARPRDEQHAVQAAVAVEEQCCIRLLRQQQRVHSAREPGAKYGLGEHSGLRVHFLCLLHTQLTMSLDIKGTFLKQPLVLNPCNNQHTYMPRFSQPIQALLKRTMLQRAPGTSLSLTFSSSPQRLDWMPTPSPTGLRTCVGDSAAGALEAYLRSTEEVT